jgi:hypothetical protein
VQRFVCSVDRIRTTRRSGHDELLIIHINTNRASAACVRSSDGSGSYASAPQDGDSVVCFYSAARHNVKSHTA